MNSPDVRAPRLPWTAADPFPFYEMRRGDGDVVWDDTAQAWLILGFRAARDVLGGQHWTSDPRANKAQADIPMLTSSLVDANMLFTDKPVHPRLRGAARDVFTRSFVGGLGAGIESICAEVVARLPRDEIVDVMSRSCCPYRSR